MTIFFFYSRGQLPQYNVQRVGGGGWGAGVFSGAYEILNANWASFLVDHSAKHLDYFNHIFRLSQLQQVTKECYQRSFLESSVRSFFFGYISYM